MYKRQIQNSFLPEFHELLKKESLSLAELNEYLWVWLDKYYHERVHSATKQTPRLRFETCGNPLRTATLEQLYDVFLVEEKRTVDKTKIFSLNGRTFETVPELVQKRILVRFDPYDLSTTQVYYEGKRYPDAVRASLPEHAFTERVPDCPAAKEETPSSGLNFLTALKNTGQEGLTYHKTPRED